MKESDIMEAVYRLLESEVRLKDARVNAGKTFEKAKKLYNIAELSRLTGVPRPRIYWLIKKANQNDESTD